MEKIRDNFAYFSIEIYVVGTRHNCLGEAILMSTHNICFYGELMKIILELSSNTLLICSSVIIHEVPPNSYVIILGSIVSCHIQWPAFRNLDLDPNDFTVCFKIALPRSIREALTKLN